MIIFREFSLRIVHIFYHTSNPSLIFGSNYISYLRRRIFLSRAFTVKMTKINALVYFFHIAVPNSYAHSVKGYKKV